MRFLINIIIISLLLISTSCNKKEENTINKISISEYNFEKFIKFKNYDYIYKTNENGGFFTTSYDSGITYDPKNDNDFGNLVTYLIPKKFLFFKNNLKLNEFDENYSERLEDVVNKMSVKEIKEYFDIYVFFIDKKYLILTPNSDSPNKEKEKHNVDLYQYKVNKWLKLDSYTASNEEIANHESDWKDNYIQKICKKKQEQFFDTISKLKVDNSWYRSYFKLFDYLEYKCDYEIIVNKNECSIIDRNLNDILVPYQSKDTLFLFHKKSLERTAYIDVNFPDIVITKVDTLYYIQKQSFLENKNYIKEKVYDHGYLEDK